jgi:hypothetical protein
MNKKLLLIGISLSLCIGASGQIGEGKIIAGGSVGLSASTYKEVYNGVTGYESMTTNIWFMPRAGYFITDNIAVGTAFELSMYSTKFDDDERSTSMDFYLTPFGRYYLPQGIFAQAEIGIGLSNEKWFEANGDLDEDYPYSSLKWSLGIGYAHFLNNYVALEPMISYISTITTYRDDTNWKEKTGNFFLQLGFSIYLAY